jgi:hypothetical protein
MTAPSAEPRLYSLYGLRLRSNEALACLEPAEPGPTDLELRFRAAAAPGESMLGPSATSGEIVETDRGVQVHRDRETGSCAMAYEDGTEFLVGPGGTTVHALTPAGSTLEDTLTYFVGPVMGFILRLRGVVSLHASTVVVGGRAVCFCGVPGAGKSSAAAAFARRGHAVLTEDIAPLDEAGGGFSVRPGYPRVNLWDPSAAALFGSTDALPRITPTWGKRYMALGELFRQEGAPLGAVYVLDGRHDRDDTVVRERPMGEALFALASNGYVTYLLDAGMRAHEFGVLNRLVRSVPVRFVSAPDDLSRLDAFCDALLADISRLPGFER